MIPSVLDWRITSSCSMDCGFCYGPKGIESVGRDDAFRVIDKIHQIGVDTVCITGGEPLQYPFIVDLMKDINSRGMGIFLSTEGDQYLEFRKDIEKFLTKLSVPIDGPNAEMHSYCGRSEENFENVLSILEYYKGNPRSFQIKIATLLTSRNISSDENLIGIYNLLSDYSIDLWKIYELLPAGRARENYRLLGDTEDLFTFVTDALNAKIEKKPTFQIALSRRRDRDLGYFIIQPNGDLIIPEDNGVVVHDRLLGNMLSDPAELLMSAWQALVNYRNYVVNVRLASRKYVLDESDRKILFELDRDPKQSPESLSKAVGCSEEAVTPRLKFLFDKGVIKNVIPIVNLDKLGFMVYLVNLSLGAVDRESYGTIIESLVNNPNVAWVARCSGKWSVMIAVFAKNANQFTNTMMDITNVCGEKLVSYDTHIVYEKYVLGQRYLLIEDRKTDFVFDRSRISLDGESTHSLSQDEHLVLSKIRESREASVLYISQHTGMSVDNVEKTIDRLQKADVLKKFQPVYDVSLLGYEWYEVFVRFKNLTEAKRRKFINFIHSIPQVVHINCTIGAWDMNFEIHSENRDEFDEIYTDVRKRFSDIIRKEEFVKILEECKFNFLVDVVLEEWQTRI